MRKPRRAMMKNLFSIDMRPVIAVIYGGNSSEYEISVQSGRFVAANIDTSRYEVLEMDFKGLSWRIVSVDGEVLPSGGVEVDKNDFSVILNGRKVLIDYAFIMIHGTPGENGLLQAYLEMLGIPSSGCSSFVSAVTFDKFSAKSYLRDTGICHLADDILLHPGDSCSPQEAVSKLGLPMFVKPTDSGSSFGVTKVKSPEEFLPAVDYAFAEGKTVIAEKFISGREIDDAVYFDGKQVIALPPVQIVPQKEYFDFEAKYEGWSKEICPAPITEAEDRMIRECSVRIYERFGCRGFVRVDYFLTDSGELFFLEMNTVPGMTAESLVPKEIRAAGMDVRDFLSVIIETTFDGGHRH